MTLQSIQTPPASKQVFSNEEESPRVTALPQGRLVESAERCGWSPGRLDWFQYEKTRLYFWRRYEMPIAHLPRALEGLRILHLTDFHLERHWATGYDDLLRRIRENPPDLLLATGDYVDDKHDCRPAVPLVRRLIAGFAARHGCFGIFGNHDTDALVRYLGKTNLRMVGGERVVLSINGASIELIGLPDVQRCRLRPDFIRNMPRRKAGVVRIVLSHFPDHWPRSRALEPDVFLCGHTHGGQVCLPGGIPIIRHAPMPRRLCTGISRLEKTWYVVNRGFGFSGPPVRLFCPPEVIELVLRRAE